MCKQHSTPAKWCTHMYFYHHYDYCHSLTNIIVKLHSWTTFLFVFTNAIVPCTDIIKSKLLTLTLSYTVIRRNKMLMSYICLVSSDLTRRSTETGLCRFQVITTYIRWQMIALNGKQYKAKCAAFKNTIKANIHAVVSYINLTQVNTTIRQPTDTRRVISSTVRFWSRAHFSRFSKYELFSIHLLPELS
jgi:hypothetical protein